MQKRRNFRQFTLKGLNVIRSALIPCRKHNFQSINFHPIGNLRVDRDLNDCFQLKAVSFTPTGETQLKRIGMQGTKNPTAIFLFPMTLPSTRVLD